jgi:type VI secretion system protein ImpG
MVDELLPHYNRELTYIRRLAAEFAETHPKIAGRLRLSADAVEDPHVARLIEGFAFLTARVRQKLDDEFPELTDALLGVLYPHYTAPVPSMAIAQFQCAPDLAGPVEVPSGVLLDTEPVAGEPCRYRTCYPTTVWPIALEAAALTGRPIVAPPNPKAPGAVASLRLTLRCTMPEMTFTQLGIDRLRFFLRGQPQQVFPLYELLFNNVVSVALADGPNDPNPVILPPSAIEPVGFGAEEGMLPYPARSFIGYRLLTEYFAFPEKFLFLDLAGLSAKGLVAAGNKLEVFFYFNRTVSDLERSLGEENFALGCTAVVNLFRQRAEPIQLSHRFHEYRVVPDARRPGATEVYSVDRVIATSSHGEMVEYRPFYSVRHGGEEASRVFWHAARRRAGERDPGTEVFVSLVDLDFDPRLPADWTLSAETTCLNRDLPSRLPYGGGRPTLEAVEGAPGVTRIVCMTPPTPTLRPDFGPGGRWRLVSHLTLNHLSLLDSADGAEALREILRLYDFRDSSETRAVIDSILSISGRRGVARAPARDMGAFCRGIDVAVEFDDQRFSGSGLFLLACVLERFLGLYCSVNSFSRLTAKVKGRTGVLRTWPPRAGDRVLL